MIQYLSMSNEQTHPLHIMDKNILDLLISKEKPEDLDFINLARLINRYNNFRINDISINPWNCELIRE